MIPELPFEAEALVVQYGPPALFLISFLAATLLPFSSEAAFVLALYLEANPVPVLIYASAGNSLACVFNYAVGYMIGTGVIKKMEQKATGRMALRSIEKYGPWSVFLTWLPGIGDPLTVLAGTFRIAPVMYLTSTIFFRILRYIVILGMMKGGFY